MYIFKNALISIVRNKGRNILIAIIITVIAAACSITLSIMNSANKIVDAYNSKYNVEATIGMDRKNLMNSLMGKEQEGDSQVKNSREEMIEKFNEIKSITVDEINNYGDSEYVSSYYYVYDVSMNAEDIEEATDNLIKETTTTTTKREEWGGGRPGKPGGSTSTTTTTKREEIFNAKADKGAFTLKGYSSFEAMSEFINGNYTIIDGEVSSDFSNNNVVISEELATLNELSVNDKIVLVNPNDEDLTYEFVITGIYKENTDESEDMTSMFSSSVNTIITNVAMVEKIVAEDEGLSVTVTPTFILNNTDVVEKFTNEVKEKGLSEYYTVSNNLDVVTGATKSISNVKTFAVTFLIMTLIIGGVVLLVLNMINIRERKYEIGVLRTIGMKRILVIFQFMFELLVVCIVGLMLGALFGSLSSVKIANSLLANEISNATEDYQNINQNFGGGISRKEQISNKPGKPNNFNMNGIINIEQVDKIEAVVDFKVLVQLLGIGIILTLISSLSACIAIARFSPLTILKERS